MPTGVYQRKKEDTQIGNVDDNPDILKALIEYLNKVLTH